MSEKSLSYFTSKVVWNKNDVAYKGTYQGEDPPCRFGLGPDSVLKAFKPVKDSDVANECSMSKIDKLHIYDAYDQMSVHLWVNLSCMFHYMFGNSLLARVGHDHDVPEYVVNNKMLPFNTHEEACYSLALARMFSMYTLYSNDVTSELVMDYCRRFIADIASLVNSVIKNINYKGRLSNLSIIRGKHKESFDYGMEFLWGRSTLTALWDGIERLTDINDRVINKLTGSNTFSLEMEKVFEIQMDLFKKCFINISGAKLFIKFTGENVLNITFRDLSKEPKSFSETIKDMASGTRFSGESTGRDKIRQEMTADITKKLVEEDKRGKGWFSWGTDDKSEKKREAASKGEFSNPHSYALYRLYSWLMAPEENIHHIDTIVAIMKVTNPVDFSSLGALSSGESGMVDAAMCYLGGFSNVAVTRKTHMYNVVTDYSGVKTPYYDADTFVDALVVGTSTTLPVSFTESEQSFMFVPFTSRIMKYLKTYHLVERGMVYTLSDFDRDVRASFSNSNDTLLIEKKIGEVSLLLKRFFNDASNMGVCIKGVGLLMRIESRSGPSISVDITRDRLRDLFMETKEDPEEKTLFKFFGGKEDLMDPSKNLDISIVYGAPNKYVNTLPGLDSVTGSIHQWNVGREYSTISNLEEIASRWWVHNNVHSLFVGNPMSLIDEKKLMEKAFIEDVNRDMFSIVSGSSFEPGDTSLVASYVRVTENMPTSSVMSAGVIRPSKVFALTRWMES